MDDKDGVWKTIRGRRVFIENGESLSEAIRKSGKFIENEDISYTSEIKKSEIIEKYNITEEEQSTIKNYTSDGYREINPELKANKGNLEKCSRETQRRCEHLDSALQKLPKYDGIVHRKESAGQSDYYKEGMTYTNDAYTSTTAWSDVGGIVQLEIKQSSGCNISKLSTSPGENEVLLPRGFTYKVTKVTKTDSGYVKVYAEEVR